MKTILSVVLSVFLSLFFIACDTKSKNSQMVDFTLTTTKGENIDLTIAPQMLTSKEFKNKLVLVNFWAPWCAPCIKEMPSFVELQEKYKDDFIIIGVSYDEKITKEELDNFIKKFNVNFPITVGSENKILAMMLDDVKMIPESFLYSKDGVLLEKFIGEISKNKLENYIKNN